MKFELFGKKRVRGESTKEIAKEVNPLPFADRITELKAVDPMIEVKVRRSSNLQSEAGYLGNSIFVDSVDPVNFDVFLKEAFGGGTFIVEFFRAGKKMMLKGDPPRPETFSIQVAGEPKRAYKKLPTEEVQRRNEGLLFDKQQNFFMEMMKVVAAMGGNSQAMTPKDTIEMVATINRMLPEQPDQMDQFERMLRFSNMLAQSQRPPVVTQGANGGGRKWYDSILGGIAGHITPQLLTQFLQSGQNPPGLSAPITAASFAGSPVTTPPFVAGASPPQWTTGTLASQAGFPGGFPPATPDPAPGRQTQFPMAEPQQQARQRPEAPGLPPAITARLEMLENLISYGERPENVFMDMMTLLNVARNLGIITSQMEDALENEPGRAFDVMVDQLVTCLNAYPEREAVKRMFVSQMLGEDEEEADYADPYDADTPEQAEDEPSQMEETAEQGDRDDERSQHVSVSDEGMDGGGQ